MSKTGVSKRNSNSEAVEAIVEVKQRRWKRSDAVQIKTLVIWNIVDKQKREVDAKECTKCNALKELIDFNDGDSAGGKRAVCRNCVRHRIGSKNRQRKVEVISVGGNALHVKECSGCKEILPLEKYSKGKSSGGKLSKCKQCQSAYRQLNKDRISEQKKIYRMTNIDAALSRSKAYYARNRESISIKHAEYRKKHPEHSLARTQRYISRKKLLPTYLSINEYTQMQNSYLRACVLTGEIEDLHVDHFIAVSTGHGGTIRENLCLLAGKINTSKNSHNPFEWIHTRPDIDANRFDAVVAYLADLNGLTLDEYRQFVDWCYANPRTIDEIKRYNERYGYVVSSLELWREATGAAFPIRIDFRNNNEKEASAC